MRIAELGEFGLIKRLNQDLIAVPEEVICGIGDDAAVLPARMQDILFTVDMLVEEVHFSLNFSTLYQVGWKAMVSSVSDIAAMGGKPSNATISLAIPRGIEVEMLEELYAGMRAAGQQFGVNIVGGDTVKTTGPMVVNVSLLGWVDQGKAVYRSGAQPGDLILVSGTVGDSAGGLKVLKNELSGLPPAKREWLVKKHREPQPQPALGQALAASGWVTAMNDVSDGLASEILEITTASQVGCAINDGDIPISVPLFRLAAQLNLDAMELALFGGEDYQLVFTIRPEHVDQVEELAQQLGQEVTVLGQITELASKHMRRTIKGKSIPLVAEGYNHFRG